MKLKQNIVNICLGVILLFSLFLHLYKILNNPPSLFSDEVDANYQAFVFNQRLTDYYGNKFPIHFHSYSDWRTSLYVYSTAFVQKFVGHTDLAARLPAAIYGTLAVFAFFLLIKQLFNSSKWALTGALLLSLSPWLTHYSRIGFEVSGMLFVLILGLYYWIKFTQNQKNKNLYLSIVFFLVSIYFYSTAKLFLLLIGLALIVIWFKTLIKLPLKTITTSVLLIVIISLPFIVDTLKGRAGYRFSYISIFSDPTVSQNVDFQRQQDSYVKFGDQIGLTPTLFSKVFHNKLSKWSEMFLKNYYSSFSTDFLFLTGDGNLRHGFQTSGYLLLPDLLFIILGFSTILKKKFDNNKKLLIFFALCLIFAPIPFSLTRDSIFPHGTRLIIMLPFLAIFSLIGIREFCLIFKSKILFFTILILYFISFTVFAHQYFYHYPNLSAREWHTGMKAAVNESLSQKDKYSKIFYSNSYEPFMPFFLNYSRYLPANKNISSAEAIKWDNNDYFTGMQAENKFYIGNLEWSILFTKNLPSDILFIVPSKETIRIQSSLDEYNKSHPKTIHMNQLNKISKIYTEQEEFYLLTFDYNK